MRITHPERPGIVLYEGPTQLTEYVCQTSGCPYGTPRHTREIREKKFTAEAVYPPAVLCSHPGGCGQPRARLAGRTRSDPRDV